MSLAYGEGAPTTPILEVPPRDYLAERIASLFSTSPATAVGNVVAGSLVFGIYHLNAPLGGLGPWLGLLVLLMLVRLGLVVVHRRNPRLLQPLTWARLTMCQCAAVGLVWGIGAIWLMRYGSPYQDIIYACIALASVMGALSNVSFWPAHLAFHVPMFFFLGIAFALDDEPQTLYLAIAAWAVCPFIAEMGRRLQSRFNAALKLAWENQVLAYKYALANRELALLSRTDNLTRLANKRHLDETLEREWMRSQRNGEPLAVLMLDVDHFKLYNDTYGHLAGDACLRQLAETIHHSVREQCDFTARFGGEEFCVVMPDTDLATAREIAERIRAAVEALQLPHAGSARGHVTVSIGVASSAQSQASCEEDLVGNADKALYEAKRRGRNRVETFGPQPVAA